jgi:hypothetical protein
MQAAIAPRTYWENGMSKFVKTAAAVAMLVSGATYAAAQTQNPNADPRPLPPSGENQQPYDKKAEPTNPPADSGVGSRPIGPPAARPPATSPPVDAKPETPADKNTTNLKKLDKQGRGGQQN